MVKILIADDHPLFREAVRDVVRQVMEERGWDHAVVEATDSREMFAAVAREEDFDLILLDLFMPGAQGLADLVTLRDRVPGTPIVVISSLSDAATVRQAIVCGAAGFVPKSTPKDRMQAALALVLDGGVAVPPPEPPAAPRGRAATDEDREPLTARQIAVLALLAQGKSNKGIANELDISEMTVKAHMSSILRKLGVATRAEAIVAFQRAPGAEHATPPVQPAARGTR